MNELNLMLTISHTIFIVTGLGIAGILFISLPMNMPGMRHTALGKHADR